MSEHQQDVYESFDGGNGSFGKAPPSTAHGVGDMLREARQRLGLELPDVAATLRIRLVFLSAIEEGRFKDLPGTAYASGFLRSYSEYVGLDAEEVIRRFKAEVSGQSRKAELYFPTPVPESRAPGGTILLVALVLAGLAYGGWYYLSATDRSMVDLVPALPERFSSLLERLPWSSSTSANNTNSDMPDAAMEPAPAKVDVPKPAEAMKAVEAMKPAEPPKPVEPPKPAPAPAASTAMTPPPAPSAAMTASHAPAPAPTPATPTASVTPPVPAPATANHAPAPAAAPAPQQRVVVDMPEDEVAPMEPTPLNQANATQPAAAPAAAPAEPAPAAAQPPAPPATPTPQGRSYGTQNKNSHITLLAKQDSWVQVRDGGEQLFTRVLRPGDTYRVPDRAGLKLRTGNAGGIVVVKDGVEGAPMGSVGQVLRDFPLESGSGAAAE